MVAAAAVTAAVAFGAPVLLTAAGPAVTPDPAPIAPAPATTTTVPTPASSAPPPPSTPSCADYATADEAAAALDADPRLAPLLDTDGDGQPCEVRFAPAEPPPAVEPEPPGEACPSTGFGGVRDHVAQAGHHLADRFGIPLAAIGGVAARARTSYHPGGRALDFTVDRATGDDLAAYALERMDELGVIEVIWRQRINFGSGWEPMADRGSDTENHLDHVHLSFTAEAPGPGITC